MMMILFLKIRLYANNTPYGKSAAAFLEGIFDFVSDWFGIMMITLIIIL